MGLVKKRQRRSVAVSLRTEGAIAKLLLLKRRHLILLAIGRLDYRPGLRYVKEFVTLVDIRLEHEVLQARDAEDLPLLPVFLVPEVFKVAKTVRRIDDLS